MSENEQPHNETAGIIYAASAYGLWGVLPLYWHVLGDVPPFELSYHRMVWCALFGLAVVTALGRLKYVWHAVCTPRTLAALTISSLLIAINWIIFIYSIATAQLVEASLGSYITPLLSIMLGVAVLGERLSKLQITAIALAAVALIFKVFALGHVPWIALSLAVSFGFYGFMRKRTPVAALDGLTIETCLLLPLNAGILLYWGWQGTGAFTTAHIGRDILLVLGGPLTALPLALFAAGARRVRLSTLGFLQYLSPSLSLIVAIMVLGEKFTVTDGLTFGLVWVALALVTLDRHVKRSAVQAPSRIREFA